MKRVGLYFGSFNPIHIGHLIIANHFVEFTDLEELWFVVSPQNPLKKKQSLLDDTHRLAMVKIAIDDNLKFKASDIEFNMPQPSYTIDTLAYLTEEYADNDFVLIMGEDNLQSIEKWKNYELLLENYSIYVYPRPNADGSKYFSNPRIKMIDAPKIEISASFIRKSIKENKDVRYLLYPPVSEYIDEMNFYK